MTIPDLPSDDERLYQLLHEERWLEALRWLHRAWRRLDGDARARRAAETFDEAFFAELRTRPVEALEQRLMLHHGRMRVLPEAELARLTGELARQKRAAGDEEAVRSLERMAPQRNEARPDAAHGGVQHEDVSLEGVPVRLTRIHAVPARPEAQAPLFKSEQERVFFETLRRMFPTHLVYPNAALSATLDFESIEKTLSEAERRYFFQALVDAVVVDPLDAFRPVYFFELDSALHDTDERRRKDRLKDRILANAGQVLFRLRRTEPEAASADLATAIRAAIAGRTSYVGNSVG